MIGEVDSDGNGIIFFCIKNFYISWKYNKFKNLSKVNIIFNYLMEVGMIWLVFDRVWNIKISIIFLLGLF